MGQIIRSRAVVWPSVCSSGLRDATTVHCDATRPHTGIQWPLFQAPWHSIRVGAAACSALRLATGTMLPCKLFRLPISLLCSSLVTRASLVPLRRDSPDGLCPSSAPHLPRSLQLARERKTTRNIPIPRPWPAARQNPRPVGRPHWTVQRCMQLQDAADMHQGPLSGFQARSLRAAILRTGQTGTVDFLRCSIDVSQSRAESNGALEGAPAAKGSLDPEFGYLAGFW